MVVCLCGGLRSTVYVSVCVRASEWVWMCVFVTEGGVHLFYRKDVSVYMYVRVFYVCMYVCMCVRHARHRGQRPHTPSGDCGANWGVRVGPPLSYVSVGYRRKGLGLG